MAYSWYGAGLLLGALSIAAVAAVVGGLVQALVPAVVRVSALAVPTLVVLVREAWPLAIPIPENRRLVPQHVEGYGRVLGPLQFGFEMGTGVRTYSPSALPHLVVVALVLVIPAWGAVATATGFAFARWIMPIVSNGYDKAGGWSAAWQDHRLALARLTTIGAMASLAMCVVAVVR